jgi:hypothetical protein
VSARRQRLQNFEFSTELIQYAARDHFPSEWLLRDLATTSGHTLHKEAARLLQASTEYTVGAALDRAVSAMRIKRLVAQSSAQTPDPYSHPDLRRIAPNSQELVQLSAFDLALRSPSSGESVFELLPSLEKRNSSHWCLGVLQKLLIFNPLIRLDPFMIAPRKGYAGYMAKMDVYGRPLTWQKVLQLRDESAHRWMPDRQDSDVAFTDAIWAPRDEEIHLRCEEVPTERALTADRGIFILS